MERLNQIHDILMKKKKCDLYYSLTKDEQSKLLETVTREEWMKLIRINPYLISEMPKYMFEKKIAWLVIKFDGNLIRHVPKHFLNKKLSKIAFDYNPETLEFIPLEHVTPEMVEVAKRCGYFVERHLPFEISRKWLGSKKDILKQCHNKWFKMDKDTLLELVRLCPHLIKNVPKSLQDEDFYISYLLSYDVEREIASKWKGNKRIEEAFDKIRGIITSKDPKNYKEYVIINGKTFPINLIDEYLTTGNDYWLECAINHILRRNACSFLYGMKLVDKDLKNKLFLMCPSTIFYEEYYYIDYINPPDDLYSETIEIYLEKFPKRLYFTKSIISKEHLTKEICERVFKIHTCDANIHQIPEEYFNEDMAIKSFILLSRNAIPKLNKYLTQEYADRYVRYDYEYIKKIPRKFITSSMIESTIQKIGYIEFFEYWKLFPVDKITSTILEKIKPELQYRAYTTLPIEMLDVKIYYQILYF